MQNNRRQFLKNSFSTFLGAYTALNSLGLSAKTTKKNNILFITIDDLNAWIMGSQRHPLVKCPNLDKLMQTSISFTNAHCAAPVCAASRAALMTGVAPHESGMYTNAQSASTGTRRANAHIVINDVPHLTTLFKENGYHNVGAGKIYHRWVSDEAEHSKHYHDFMPELVIPNKIKEHGDGYAGYKFYPFPVDNPVVDNLGHKSGQSLVAGAVDRNTNMFDKKMPDELIADWLCNKLLELGKTVNPKPFFMTAGFLRPHVPYTAPQEYFDAIDRDKITLPSVDDMLDIPEYGKAMTMGLIPGGDHKAVSDLGEEYWKDLMHGYLASIAFVDDQLGKVLSALNDSGNAENTWIFVMSDHGQNFGEKQNWRKMCLWDESTRTPLIVSPPGGTKKKITVDQVVSLLDVYPTLCSISNLPQHNKIAGQSLLPIINNAPYRQSKRTVLISWHYKNYAVKASRYKLIQYRDGSEELYDTQEDPLERTNLITQNKFQPIVESLRSHIPSSPSLPVGMSKWKGDSLDAIVGKVNS